MFEIFDLELHKKKITASVWNDLLEFLGVAI